MKHAPLVLLSGLVLLGAAGPLAAQQPPSYARQVKPFFARYCLECHNSSTTKGDLDLETFKGLRQGGKDGKVLVPGKPDESRLVLQPEHRMKPMMPPKKAKQPSPKEVAVLRAWVAAGARDDSTTATVAIPVIKPRVPTPLPITALAYQPDGKVLAIGRYQEVLLFNTAGGEEVATVYPLTGKITALAYSPNGRRLAVADSSPAMESPIRLYAVGPGGAKPERVLPGHTDEILDLAFSPDGRTLASTGYDRLIKLWDVSTGKELHTLKDHSDAVYGLAFRPDGKLLASGGADRAVKVWDVATGARLYTLGESTDWVYAVAWSPDGRHLAAAGVDKSIRVWEVTPQRGWIIQSVFAHEGPVLCLAYAADGKTLYSLGEDHVIKAWETGQMVERKVYARQPESTLALALRPDGKQLAVGRYNGVVHVLDEAGGQVVAEPLPVRPKPPELSKLWPGAGPRGQTLRLTFAGKHLDTATAVVAGYPGVTAKLVTEGRSPNRLAADVTFPPNTPAGIYKLGLKSAAGPSGQLPFIVDLFPAVPETEPNDSAQTGQHVVLPVTVIGAISRPGNVDYYRFEATAGQEIGAQILTAAIGSKLSPVLQVLDMSDNVLAESTNGVLGFTAPKAGSYALGVRDRDYRGGAGHDWQYRLYMGAIPIVTAVYPLGLQRGTETAIHVAGVDLGKTRIVRVKAPANAPVGSRLPVRVTSREGAPLGEAQVVVGEFPEVVADPDSMSGCGVIPVPGTANGRLTVPGAADTWRFTARKGQRLIVEVHAQRLGSPLDSVIEILDARGQPVPRATLRAVAKSYATFRDHDGATPGIRMETWSEFRMNDYVWVGNELLRIWQLPRNPDDDCDYYSHNKQRLAFLDTTPTYIPLGTPMYKVTIHPPGTTFPPNGFPVIQLTYRNDDGGPGYGKDSRLFFDPPADGMYQVRISDARGQGGSDYAYRLTVRPPRPDFTVHFQPSSPAVWKGGAVPITIQAERADGFAGAIEVHLENLPPGFRAPRTTIPAGEESTALALWADPDARTPAAGPPLKLVARAGMDGRQILREATGGLPKAVEPGDIVTTTDQPEVTVEPGKQVYLTASIKRRHGFKGRVPLEVRGLPHGIHVLDIGLNGILITENDTRRTFAIYAEPWVKPGEHPFVVLAEREGKKTEHAARSVLLKVVAPK